MSVKYKALARVKGPWAASTLYLRGDVASYLGALYAAKDPFTSGASFDATKWDLVLAAPVTADGMAVHFQGFYPNLVGDQNGSYAFAADPQGYTLDSISSSTGDYRVGTSNPNGAPQTDIIYTRADGTTVTQGYRDVGGFGDAEVGQRFGNVGEIIVKSQVVVRTTRAVILTVLLGAGGPAYKKNDLVISPTGYAYIALKDTQERLTDSASWVATALIQSNPIYLQAQLVSGNAAVATHVLKPGLRVPAASSLKEVVLRCDTAPVGSALTVTVERFNNGASQGIIATVSIPDGLTVGSVTGLSAPCAKGDMLKFNVTSIGSTTAGADVTASLELN